jgi:hypothetical protein
MARAEKLRAREKTTERRLAWQVNSARARKMLRDAEKLTDPAAIQQLTDKAVELLKRAEEQRKKPPANLVRRQSLIGSWRATEDKPLPSERLIRWYQKNGRWCANADGTYSGDATFTVPISPIDTPFGPLRPRDDADAFGVWFARLIEGLNWFNDEPVFWAIGVSLGGVERTGQDPATNRYSKIRGQTGWISYWQKPFYLGGDKRWIDLANRIKLSVVPNIQAADLRVTSVSFFAHYGPTSPLHAGEFACEQPVVPPPPPARVSAKKPPKRVPGKKLARKATRIAFVVYDEVGKRYASRKVYSGKLPKIWVGLRDAFIFDKRSQAQSVASNLNASRPKGRRYRAVVWPVELPV